MKEEKLFELVQNIDDDLICEMLDYSPETDDNVCEGVLYSVPEGVKRKHFWRYPVTAAALLSVMAAVLFFINFNGVIPDNTEVKTESEQTEITADTNNTETSADTEASGKTEPIVTESPVRIIPDKVVFVEGTNVLFTNQYPEIPVPDLSEAQFTEMSTYDLCRYYGLEDIAAGTITGYPSSSGEVIDYFTEITDENISHGIYTFPDGSTFDINKFTFEIFEDMSDRAKRFTVTVGKNSVFGQEYDPRPDFKVGQTVYYNEEKQTFFMVYEKYGSCIMISGELDELSDFDDPTIKKLFDDLVSQNSDEYWQGVPGELILFRSAVFECVGPFENITLEDWNNADKDACIIPDKLVFINPIYILYTDKYPEIPQPDLSQAKFISMSTSELCEYYGLLNIPYEMKEGNLIEVTDENTSHGIYTLPDGSNYDINTFTFYNPYDDVVRGKKFTVTVGRDSIFGQKYNQEPTLEVGKTVYYNEEDKTFFMVNEKYGSCIMISGNADELSDFDSPTVKAYYDTIGADKEEYLKGVPCELELFIQNVATCVFDFGDR